MGVPTDPNEMTREDIIKLSEVGVKRVNELAQELYGKPYKELSIEQLEAVLGKMFS